MVAANSAPCGACAACGRGEETLCENLLPLLNGAYAELILVPERIARRNLDLDEDVARAGHRVRDGLDPQVAGPVEDQCPHGVKTTFRASPRR